MANLGSREHSPFMHTNYILINDTTVRDKAIVCDNLS